MTTASEDRYLALTARRNRKGYCSPVKFRSCSRHWAVASRQTIYRRLNEKGLYARSQGLTGDSKRVYIWRESGTRNDPSNIVERDRFGSGGCDGVHMDVTFLFMDDNARPHRANLVDEFLESEDIKRIPWAANSLTLTQ
ncbi:transposable element Tc1 transposase [Trichonephila clavipes]|nr:transposable element Tc1 transposase [Trichonephila clavipes]